MCASPNRRDFLRLLAGGAAALALPAVARAQTRQPFGLTPLGDRLRLISGAGGNVVVLNGPASVLMVNGGAAEHSAALLDFLAEGTGAKRVEILFNTDWHPDHTGSNDTLGTRGARIIAHEHTKQYLGAELHVDWQRRTYTPLPSQALPTQTFRTTGKMTFGGARVEYGHLGQAHTDGDIYVFFPESNVLVAGDALSVGTYPLCDYTTGGWLGGLATATRTMVDMSNAETRVVPGVGPVQTRADLQAQLDMLVALRDRLGKMMRSGMSADDMLAAGATKDYDAKWGDPALFLQTTYRGMWLHVRELGGIV